jgi:hypothetical protein
MKRLVRDEMALQKKKVVDEANFVGDAIRAAYLIILMRGPSTPCQVISDCSYLHT